MKIKDICLCGAPMVDGVCAEPGCVCSKDAKVRLNKPVCPHCDSDDIYENNVVHVRLKVTKWEQGSEAIGGGLTGEPENFEYPWTVVDDTIRTVFENEAERWYCGGCGKEFDVLKVVDAGPTAIAEDPCNLNG